jgi:hypothetical protein
MKKPWEGSGMGINTLGNHMQHNHTERKAELVRSGDQRAFIDPSEWQPYNLWCIENLEKMIKKEKA